MYHNDFSPLYRSTIGFDRVNQLMNSALQSPKQDNYPPYNIERIDENNYSISIAVAGFCDEELEIEVEKNTLTVSGKKETEEHKGEMLYQGIASRSFRKQFQLDEQIEVSGARIESGMLTVKLVRVLPEHLKPRKIDIKTGKNSSLQAA